MTSRLLVIPQIWCKFLHSLFHSFQNSTTSFPRNKTLAISIEALPHFEPSHRSLEAGVEVQRNLVLDVVLPIVLVLIVWSVRTPDQRSIQDVGVRELVLENVPVADGGWGGARAGSVVGTLGRVHAIANHKTAKKEEDKRGKNANMS